MAEPAPTRPANAEAAVPEPPAHSQGTTHYSLSEAPTAALVKRLAQLARSLKYGQFRLFMALAELTADKPHHSITLALRDLCELADISTSVFPEALKALIERNLVTVRHGGRHSQNAYKVNFFETICASFSDAPNKLGASNFEPPEHLFSMHRASKLDAPPDANKALASAAAALDAFRSENPDLDRVLNSKISDFDKETTRVFRSSLQYFMRKFGVDERDRRYLNTGENPPLPDNEITARFLAVAHPQQLMDMLENLILEAKQEDARTPDSGPHPGGTYNPRKYGWFVTTALSRLCGVHFSKTKKAEQQFRIHRRSQRAAPAPPAEQTGLDFATELVRAAVTGAKKIG
jgi:hypothetical protein